MTNSAQEQRFTRALALIVVEALRCFADALIEPSTGPVTLEARRMTTLVPHLRYTVARAGGPSFFRGASATEIERWTLAGLDWIRAEGIEVVVTTSARGHNRFAFTIPR